MRWQPLVLAALCGCSASAVEAPPEDDMMVVTDPPMKPDALSGRIVGLDRQPLAGVSVSLCQSDCRSTTTSGSGDFAFADVAPNFYTLRARRVGQPQYVDLDFPLYALAGRNPRLLPLILPNVTRSGPVPPAEGSLAIDDVLTLALDGRALALPTGDPAATLGGVRIPTDLYPDFCVPSARVLAMWAFSPTGIRSGVPVAVTISESLGLAPGTAVRFIEVDPKDGRPQVVTDGSVAADGKSIRTRPGMGLQRLGWLLVAVLQGGA